MTTEPFDYDPSNATPQPPAEAPGANLTQLKRWLRLLDQGYTIHVADEIREIVRAAS